MIYLGLIQTKPELSLASAAQTQACSPPLLLLLRDVVLSDLG